MIRRLEEVGSLKELPTDGGRYLGDSAGEFARVLNGTPRSYLAYVEFNAGGRPRGNHVHRIKTEDLYVISGVIAATFVETSTGDRREQILEAGDIVTIAPGWAHAFVSLTSARALEMATHPYDVGDTYAFPITAS